jgi:hypothetical protein
VQVVDKYGNTFGQGHLIITSKSGKSKLPVVTVAWGNITGVLANQTDLQDALNLKVPTARTITINGVTQDLTANRTWTISTGITVDTTPITGGTSSRLLFDNAGTVGETSGINWNSSTATLSLLDSPFYSQAGNSFANTAFSITGTASSNYTIYSSRQFIFNTGQSMYFNTDTDGGSALDRAWYFAGARTGITGGRTYGALTVDSSGFPSFTLYNNDNGARILLASNATSYFNGGNLLVGTTTDAGYKLDVNGDLRIQGDVIKLGNNNPIINFGTAPTFQYNGNSYMRFRPNGEIIIGNQFTPSNSNLYVNREMVADESGYARGVYFKNTLVAAANNDVLVGLDINPTFTNGAFTGLTNVDLRISGANVTIGSSYGYGALYGYNNDGIVQIKTAATYKTQMWFRPSGNAGGYNSAYWSRIEHDMGTLSIIGSSYGQLSIASSNGSGNGARIYFSGSKGFLPPRMSNAQMLAIATPAEGLVVYDLTNRKLCCYDGATWQSAQLLSLQVQSGGFYSRERVTLCRRVRD